MADDASGVGKFCRAGSVRQRPSSESRNRNSFSQADPRSPADAAVSIVAWVSRGMPRPTDDDLAMLRLILLALLPQIGGLMLMVGGGLPVIWGSAEERKVWTHRQAVRQKGCSNARVRA
jgi:hypothetical protein